MKTRITKKPALKTRMSATATAVCLAVGLWAMPASYASAGILKGMKGMLHSNVTRPDVYKSQTRGGFVGGSIAVRVPTGNISVFQFTPPGYSAGCGGIDLFGGSFSFINSAQLKAIFRQIAMSAAAAAFKRMLDAIEPKLSSIMTQFQGIMQALNQLAVDTCETGMAISDSLFGDHTRMNNLKDSMVALWDTVTGEGGGNPVQEKGTGAAGLRDSGTTPAATVCADTMPFCGNTTWNLLAENNAGNAISTHLKLGNAKPAEIIQSLLGTKIYDPNPAKGKKGSIVQPNTGKVDKRPPKGAAEDNSANQGGETPRDERGKVETPKAGENISHNPTISWKDFISATQGKDGKDSGKKFLSCGGKTPVENGCLEVTVATWEGFDGIEGMVKKIMFGDSKALDPQPGSLVYKMSDKCGEDGGDCDLTDEQKDFINMTNLPIFSLMDEIAKEGGDNPDDNLQALAEFARLSQDLVVRDVLMAILIAYDRAVSLALQGGKKTKIPEETIDNARALRKAMDEIVINQGDEQSRLMQYNLVLEYANKVKGARASMRGEAWQHSGQGNVGL